MRTKRSGFRATAPRANLARLEPGTAAAPAFKLGLALAACSTACAMLVNCAGPQPLTVAIRASDETNYVTRLNAANADARMAYAAWKADEQGLTIEQVLQRDSQLSETRNPFDAHHDPEAVSRGAVIYKMHCARCHGDDARGQGPSILADHPANDFKSFGKRFAATLHRGAPRKWFRVIRDGSGDLVVYPDGQMTAMPPFDEALTREQIWLVITYLQSLDMHAAQSDTQTGA